jgi:hypothetical protein
MCSIPIVWLMTSVIAPLQIPIIKLKPEVREKVAQSHKICKNRCAQAVIFLPEKRETRVICDDPKKGNMIHR